MKLGTKLPLFYSVLIALLGAAFIAFTSTQVEQRMVEEEREYFETLAKTFTQNTANAIVLRDYAALSLFVDNLSQGEHVRYAAILDEEGNVLAHTRHHLEGSPLADPVSLKAAAAQQLLMQPSGGDVVDVAAPLLIAGRKWGAVRIGFSVREMKGKVAQARLTILSAGLIAIALGAAAATVLARNITRPIQVLHRGAEIIGQGNLDHRVEVSRKDEIAQLAAAFNAMAARLQADYLAIGRAKDEWATTFDAVSDLLFIHDQDFRVLRCNRAYADAAGLPYQEILGRPYYEIFPKTPGPAKGCHALTAPPDEAEEEITVAGTGRILNAKRHLIRSDAGEYLFSLHVLEDITARRRAQEARARLTAIIEATPDFVAIADPQGCSLYLNRGARKLLGIGPDDDISRVRTADSQPEWARRLVLETGIPAAVRDGAWKGETAFLDREGREIPVSQLILTHKSPAGDVGFFSTVARDLSERKLLEAQLRQAQKMEAVGRLAGGVAHDFNNVLMAITGYSELMRRRLAEDDPLRRNVAEVLKAADRAAALTHQLLAFSRKQMLQPEVLVLNAVVAGVEKMLRRIIGEDIELVTALEPGLGRAKADAGQIEQVIMNLAVNARDAMPQGGKLTVLTANADLDQDYVAGHLGARPGPHVMLAVSDTGCGMDAETVSHIFEPFFTTKEPGKGTGLGLSTVYGIVKQSGGYIWVDSEPGRGTTFKIYLPRVDEAAELVKTRAAPSEAPRGSETVLLVEDEETVRDVVREALKASGYTVLAATSGGEALQEAGRHQGPIHLAVTDLVMPDMSGRELAERLAHLHPDTKVLYMSGYTDDAVVHHGVREAGVAFLQKPFTPDALARRVRELLDAPGGARP